jgi:tRNA pseudouridine55 synthase
MARDYRSLDGVLLFDKPIGPSSNVALQKVRRIFQAEKAGHTGTLDPLATGLLPICFGEATKFSVALLDADKTYRALIRLGQTTTTADAEGAVIAEHPVTCTQTDVEVVLEKFRGEIQQLPPMHSALKHHGKPLYEYIRQGETIAREPRNVIIHELLLHRFEGNELDISVRCSKGTYIRTLAEDIGYALGCGAHLAGLRRTTVAHFDLVNSHTLLQLTEMDGEQREACVLTLECLMPDMPKMQLDETQVRRLAQGQRLALDAAVQDGNVALYGAHGFVGTGRLRACQLAPERLLASVAKQFAGGCPGVE